MAVHSLDKLSLHVIDIATEAGKLMVEAASSSISVTSKKNTTDIVTETDAAVESFIQNRLKQLCPSFDFIGEETFVKGAQISDRPCFLVDPIDGTSNFVHGLPDVCVSIGLAIDKKAVLGVVYNPFHSELWYAVRGHGAFHRTHSGVAQKLSLAPTPLRGLSSACIGIEWGSDREGPNFELNLDVFTKLARTAATGGKFVNSLRATGSAALSMCRVAAGQQDCFWECGSWAWDVAAAWCIVSEAGGLVADVHPGNWKPSLDNRRYLVVRPAASGQKEFVDEFWSVIGTARSTYGP